MSALSSTLPAPLPTRASSPKHLDPREITSTEQIAAQLALLARRESELTLALNALVADRSHIEGAILHLRELGSEVDRLAAEVDGGRVQPSASAPALALALGLSLSLSSRGLGAQNGDDDVFDAFGAGPGGMEDGLVERVRKVWETSERVGGKVRRLDEEVGRVREATDIVTEVLEPRTLSAGIQKQDWESASRACRRAMSVRTEVIESGFAGTVVPTAAQPLPPQQLLEELRNVLLHTFKTEFDAAATRKDQQAVSRFFRLWPGIGAEAEGLEAYGNFVVDLVKARNSNAGKPSSPLYYLTQLTSLLEAIAHIIDQHQPVVDKYYGGGRMRTVVGRLVGESNRVIRGLVEGWEEDRRVGRLEISDTKQSKFPLLTNPVLLPPLFPSLVNPSAPQLSLGSLATATTSHLPNLSTASTLLQSYAPGAKRPQGTSTPVLPAEEEPSGPDPRDVDKVLGELVALSGRWALFRRFVSGRLEDDETEESKPANDDILEQSGSQRAIENLLKVYYEPLEMWFLRMSIEKAHRLDSPETSSRPHVSSILDDAFYLLKLVVQRVLSCGSLATLRAMRLRITEVVERDFIGAIKRKMDAVYGVTGGGTEREKERGRDQRSAFTIYLNDLDVSADYTERLIDETLAALPQVFLPSELAAVQDELQLLKDLSGRFRAACKAGLEQLFNQLTRPRLRVLLDECYRDLSYALDEDGFAEAEEQDAVRKRFVRAWEALVDGYRDAFTDHNYQIFFTMTVETLVRPWEKMIMGMRFSELGSVRYERDIRGIANYLSTQTSFGGARDKFTRLQQIGTVLNLDTEEDAEDFYSNSGIPWRLSKVEYNAILEQRQ